MKINILKLTLFVVCWGFLVTANAGTSLGQDFVLPAGSEVQINAAQAAESYKGVTPSGSVQIQDYYQVQYLKYVQDMEKADQERYNKAAQMGLLYIPVSAISAMNTGGDVGVRTVKTSADAGLFRASESIDPAPNNPKVRPEFSSADPSDNLAREKEILEGIEGLNSAGRSSNQCQSAKLAGVPEAAYNSAMNCYQQNKDKFSNPYIVIMDLTKASTSKRLFILDAKTGAVVQSEYAMHGKGVGSVAGENGTPSGFHKLDGKLFRNGRPYRLGLEMKGMEKKNANSHERAIRLHDWGPESNLKLGLAPRTWGCIGVADEVMPELQNKLAGGTLLLNYTADADQLRQQSGVCQLN